MGNVCKVCDYVFYYLFGFTQVEGFYLVILDRNMGPLGEVLLGVVEL